MDDQNYELGSALQIRCYQQQEWMALKCCRQPNANKNLEDLLVWHQASVDSFVTERHLICRARGEMPPFLPY